MPCTYLWYLSSHKYSMYSAPYEKQMRLVFISSASQFCIRELEHYIRACR